MANQKAVNKMQIDLRAPSIPKSRRVWRLFPGDSYGFLEDFLSQNVGFLDFPGLLLPSISIAQANDMTARIAVSQEIRNIYYKEGSGANPELNVDDFKDARNTTNRGKLRQALYNFFEEAADGDVVVLPEPIYMGKIWIGRFQGSKRTTGSYRKKYGDSVIPARHIEWLNNHKENMVSSALSQSLRHQHPFTLIERSLYLEVFALAYSSFIFGENHTSSIFNQDDYADSDTAFIGNISRLAAAACKAIDDGVPGLGDGDILDIILTSPPVQYTCSQAIDIHSPGFSRFVSGTVVSLIIAALATSYITLGDSSSIETLAADISAITYINSGDAADPLCTARVSEASRRVLTALNIESTWAICKNGRLSHARAGLKSSAVPVRRQNP